MIDYAFIRLKPDFNQAKNIGNPNVSEINYTNQIHLIPNEYYCQITNLDSGIELAGDFTVKLVDQCNNDVDDITTQLAIFEFSDIRGLNQIAFEFILTKDYGHKPLHLKIIHTESESIYYSNAFICTETLKEQTSLYSYRHYGYFNGISYDKFEKYQQIRLNIWFDNVENQTDVSEYYQITTKNTIGSRALYKNIETYKCEYINRYVFERTNIMLIHDAVYVDGVRISNKPQLTSDERLGNTNVFLSGYSAFKDYNETFEYKLQIFTQFMLLSYSPTGSYLESEFTYTLSMEFNRNLINNGVTIQIFNQDGNVLVQTFTNDLIFENNTITGIINSPLENGTYYVLVSAGISSTDGELFEGISNSDYWVFIIKNGDYSSEDYSSDDYFTN